jgi:hypothetical protein
MSASCWFCVDAEHAVAEDVRSPLSEGHVVE